MKKSWVLSALFIAVVMLSVIGCSKANYKTDLSDIIGLRHTMTLPEVVLYEDNTYGNRNFEFSTNQYGDVILEFKLDSYNARYNHIYCFNKDTNELQFANYTENPAQVSFNKISRSLKEITPDRSEKSTDSIPYNSYWYGYLGDSKCSVQLWEQSGVMESIKLSIGFGEYKNDSFELFGTIDK